MPFPWNLNYCDAIRLADIVTLGLGLLGLGLVLGRAPGPGEGAAKGEGRGLRAGGGRRGARPQG